MNTLGVILARAGSVGLANKHLRLLLGRPVIEYTFDHIFNSTLLNHVVVSTDCPGVDVEAGRWSRGAGAGGKQPPATGPDAAVPARWRGGGGVAVVDVARAALSAGPSRVLRRRPPRDSNRHW